MQIGKFLRRWLYGRDLEPIVTEAKVELSDAEAQLEQIGAKNVNEVRVRFIKVSQPLYVWIIISFLIYVQKS